VKIVAFWQGAEWANYTTEYPGITETGSYSVDTYSPGGVWSTFYSPEQCVVDTEGGDFALGADADDKVTLGFYGSRAALVSHPMWQFIESGTIHITIQSEADGGITVRRGGAAGTTLITIPTGDLRAGPWVHNFQFVVTIHDTTGAVDVYLDGEASPSYTFTGDTRNGGTAGVIDTLRFTGASSTSTGWFSSQMYLMSGVSGSEPDVLGLCRVQLNQAATGTGTNTAWTGGAGDIDDWNSADGITSNVNGQLESFIEGDLSDLTNPGEVKCVRLNVLAQDLGTPGDGQIEAGLLRSGTAAYKAAFQPAISALGYAFMFFEDPNTGTAWAAGASGRTQWNACETIYRSTIA
jgi:hypothetical protein